MLLLSNVLLTEQIAPPNNVTSNNVAENNVVNNDVASNNIWSQFEGFIPNPRASFNTEFRRLWRHQGWDEDERRKRRVELFDADFDAYIGNDICNLEHWQFLCRLCSIDPVPEKITGCMEELDSVLVNIYDILDSQRTGQPVVPFNSFDDFQEYTLDDHVYPLELAKADSFLPVFLKEISSRRGMK